MDRSRFRHDLEIVLPCEGDRIGGDDGSTDGGVDGEPLVPLGPGASRFPGQVDRGEVIEELPLDLVLVNLELIRPVAELAAGGAFRETSRQVGPLDVFPEPVEQYLALLSGGIVVDLPDAEHGPAKPAFVLSEELRDHGVADDVVAGHHSIERGKAE
jgi:hypothetical protein